jgi:hypothetical protein
MRRDSVGNFCYVALLHSFGTKRVSEETSGKEFREGCEGNFILGDRRAFEILHSRGFVALVHSGSRNCCRLLAISIPPSMTQGIPQLDSYIYSRSCHH